MHNRSRRIIPLILIILLVLAVVPASATRYLYHDLGVLAGETSSIAYDVNNAGQVVGSSWKTSVYDGDAVITTYSLSGGVGTMTSLGKLAGARFSTATRITENGQIVGWSDVYNDVVPRYMNRGVYWSSPNAAAITNIGTLVAPPPDTTGFGSWGHGINESGQVSGMSYTGPYDNYVTHHAILWTSSGGMTNLGTIDGTTPQWGICANAHDINNAGVTTGYTQTYQDSPTVPFVRSAAGAWTLLPLLPGGTEGFGYTISESGTKVVGAVTVGGNNHGVLWTLTGETWSAQDLGTVGGTSSIAYDLDAVTGQIVGYGTNAGGLNRALIVEDGDTAFQDLTALTDGLTGEVYLKYAYGLNDSSWIVGQDSQGHAFLLAPNAVPIPGALLLFGSGLAGLAGWRRLRKG